MFYPYFIFCRICSIQRTNAIPPTPATIARTIQHVLMIPFLSENLSALHSLGLQTRLWICTSLLLPSTWINSIYTHIHFGQIHCITNYPRKIWVMKNFWKKNSQNSRTFLRTLTTWRWTESTHPAVTVVHHRHQKEYVQRKTILNLSW